MQWHGMLKENYFSDRGGNVLCVVLFSLKDKVLWNKCKYLK